jgi:hypothetical protein
MVGSAFPGYDGIEPSGLGYPLAATAQRAKQPPLPDGCDF